MSREVAALLARFADQLTRVEVHLGNVNADKGGSTDRRCVMEARLAGQAPLAVTRHAATLTEAYRGAARRLQRLLDTGSADPTRPHDCGAGHSAMSTILRRCR